MATRRYYSTRTGKNPNSHIDLSTLLKLFYGIYRDFDRRDYFQEAFGFICVDEGFVPGTLGPDIDIKMHIALRKADLWPIDDKCMDYTEDDLFDVIEFLYDHISKPVDGYFHSFNGCGMHYDTFDMDVGRDEFRQTVNDVLRDYLDGYELSEEGEVLALPDKGIDSLLNADLPPIDPENVNSRVDNAIYKFRRYKSSIDERREAIRNLADVLEYLRPRLQPVLSNKDERDLFEIANKFGLRHHRIDQKTDYDKPIWYSWMFYYYLASIHATVRLIKKHEEQKEHD